jgi:hypothetical protein
MDRERNLGQSKSEKSGFVRRGINFGDQSFIPPGTILLKDGTITTPGGAQRKLSNLQLNWQDPPIGSQVLEGLVGGASSMALVGGGLKILDRSLKSQQKIPRRDFVKAMAVLSAGVAGSALAPQSMYHVISKVFGEGPDVAAIAVGYPDKAARAILEKNDVVLGEVLSVLPAERIYTHINQKGEEAYGVDTVEIEADVKTQAYFVTPTKHEPLQMISSASLPTLNDTVVPVSAELYEYTKILFGTDKNHELLGQGKPLPITSKNESDVIHTSPSCLYFGADEEVYAALNGTWASLPSIAFTPQIDGQADTGKMTPLDWQAVTSKNGYLSSDMLHYWTQEEVIADIQENLEIYQSKFVDDGWTEVDSDAPAHHRCLFIDEHGVIRVMKDKAAWFQYLTSLSNNPDTFKLMSIMKPGMIIDSNDTKFPTREGGPAHGLSASGIVLDRAGNVLCAMTIDQNIHPEASQILDITKTYLTEKGILPDNGFYFVNGDEHRAGGIMINKNSSQVATMGRRQFLQTLMGR